MFGYIIFNKAEMKYKEFDIYHSYYCGLCRSLNRRYGVLGQVTLSYDMTFTALLLSSLYEPKTASGKTTCIVHPFGKHDFVSNSIIDYVADMNVLLSIYKCEDDWNDDRKILKACFGKLLRERSRSIRKQYKKREKTIRKKLAEISALEAGNCSDIDLISGLFGDIMSNIIVYRKDEWSGTLERFGYYLGRFIYILDAYDDIEEDIKKNKYNPLKGRYLQELRDKKARGRAGGKHDSGKQGFDDEIRAILSMIMSECCKEFELLPLIDNVEILRNILYSGVWGRFEEIRKNRNKA